MDGRETCHRRVVKASIWAKRFQLVCWSAKAALVWEERGIEGGFDSRGVEATVFCEGVKALGKDGGSGEREQGGLRNP